MTTSVWNQGTCHVKTLKQHKCNSLGFIYVPEYSCLNVISVIVQIISVYTQKQVIMTEYGTNLQFLDSYKTGKRIMKT